MSKRIAILNVIAGADDKKKIIFHLSIPYISNIENYCYPYRWKAINSNYQVKIDKIRENITLQFTENPNKEPVNSSEEILIDMINKTRDLNPENNVSTSIGSHSYRRNFIKVAEEVNSEFNFNLIYEFLFNLEDDIDLLKIIIDSELFIPWDWLYSEEKEKFLCELFGIGITFPEMENIYKTIQQGKHKCYTNKELHKSDKKALIIGNSYFNAEENLAPHLDISNSVKKIVELLKNTFNKSDCICLSDCRLSHFKQVFTTNAEHWKLIYFVGHFTKNGFLMDGNQELTLESLADYLNCKNKEVSSHPIVVLNGCTTFNNTSSNYKLRSLAKEFLKYGAAACIVTSIDVRVEYANSFAEHFIQRILEPNTTIGSALKYARNEIKDDDCYEWAVYHLFGDPSYILVSE